MRSLFLITVAAISVGAAEWPAYRHDAARSGATQEKLTFPMSKAWVYHPAQGPKPAWPYERAIRFDYTFHP